MRSQSSWAKRSVVMPLPGLSEYAPCARPGLKMQRRTLWTLYACNLLASVGFWFFLPLLPIFLSRRGGSGALVGAVFAAGLLASAAIRYPAGWAADRFGTRPVMIAALGFEAVLFLAYLPHLPLYAFIAVRFLHGAAAGAFWPAAGSSRWSTSAWCSSSPRWFQASPPLPSSQLPTSGWSRRPNLRSAPFRWPGDFCLSSSSASGRLT